MGVLALVLLVAWLAIVAVYRGAVLHRRTGRVALRAGVAAGTPQWWSRVLGTIGLGLGVAAALAEIAGLASFGPLDQPAVVAVGVALVAIGTAGTIVSQVAMGDAWRGDVDPTARTDLVTQGPFRLVRNPILTMTFITVLGIALIVPNVLSASMLLASLAAQQIQVRLVEEPWLREAHGDAWRRYAASTGRFVPGIGRIADPKSAAGSVRDG